MTRVKLYRRGERCLVPDGEYLMAVSQGVDAQGDWVPSEALAIRTLPQLRETLRQVVAKADGIVVQASPEFSEMAQELGLATMTVEWGCV